MKRFTLFMLFVALAVSLHAQALSENFEHEGSLPDGWITYSSGTTYKWSVAKYSTFRKYYKGFNGGDTYAMKSNTGKITSKRPAPDSWLISPEITVPENGVLNFMMLLDGSFNILSTTPEESRTHLSVLVSENGTDTTAFTHKLLTVSPYGVSVWQNYSLDLSQFAGKTIHIAFHDYGNTNGKAYTANSVYVDNVSVDTHKSSDVYVTEITSPQSGSESKQPLTVKVRNNGFDASGVKVSYSLNEGSTVCETLPLTLSRGEETTYTFNDTLNLAQGKAVDLKVWATADSDLNHDNDSLSESVTIDRHLSFPYTMTQATAESDWESSYIYEDMGVVYGWNYINNATQKIHAWSYIAPPTNTSELVSGWIPMPKGKVGFKATYKSLSAGTMNVALLDSASQVVAQQTFNITSSDDYVQTQSVFDIPEDKNCRAVISIGSGYSTQLLVSGLSFFIPDSIDVKPVAFSSPALSAYTVGDNLDVKVSVSNYGGNTAVNYPVALSVDGVQSQSGTIPSIPSGATVEYTFDNKLNLTEGTHSITFVAGSHSDGISKSLVIYQPKAYPYQETFEDTTTWKLWNTVNPDADPVYWTILGVVKGNINYAKNGTHAAYISSAANVTHDDWLISPAINITQTGRQRISYFYVTTYKSATAKAQTGLDVYVSQKNNPADIESETPAASETITDDNQNVYRQGFATIDVSTPGLYYIAFHNTGKGHDIILDDVRLDNGADLAIVDASHTAKNGFHLSGDTVSVLLQNRGATTLQNFTFRSLNNNDLATSKSFTKTLAPGDTTTVVLADAISLATPGVYNISVEALADNDLEDFNNKWQFASVECFANATLPYEENLDSTREQEQWTLTGKWQTGTYSSANAAYNGTGAISHRGKSATSGDWAYSGCISIPAGTYDMSFFYRTFLNGNRLTTYGQKFAVYLGTACNPDSMTIPVYDTQEEIVAPAKRYRKVLSTIIVPKDGEYYIGVNCTSTHSLGVLFMDAFAINATTTEGEKTDSYAADFQKRGDEWYHYDPSTQFQQWKPLNTDSTILVVQQLVQQSLAPTELPGLMVSPAFEFDKGQIVSFDLGYNISIDHPELLADTAKEAINIALYAAQTNLPDSFNIPLLRTTDITGNNSSAKASFVVPESGIYYFGIVPTGAENTTSDQAIITYHLRSFGFTAVSAGISENTLYDSRCKVYNLSGMMIGEYDSAAEAIKTLRQGSYIMKSGTSVRKVLVK